MEAQQKVITRQLQYLHVRFRPPISTDITRCWLELSGLRSLPGRMVSFVIPGTSYITDRSGELKRLCFRVVPAARVVLLSVLIIVQLVRQPTHLAAHTSRRT